MSYKIILEKAEKYEYSIFEALNGIEVNSSNRRELIVASYLTLSIQHYSSIIVLIKNRLESSAFALSRPLYDSIYRGTWVTLVARDREVEQLCVDKLKFKVTFKESDVFSLLTSAIANVADITLL